MAHRTAARRATDFKTRAHEARQAVKLFLHIGLLKNAADEQVCAAHLEGWSEALNTTATKPFLSHDYLLMCFFRTSAVITHVGWIIGWCS